MDDSGGFKKKRQNVIGISLVILLLNFLKVRTPKELDVFNIKIPIENPSYFNYAIWILFFYLVYRLYVEWIFLEKKSYKSYMANEVWLPLREIVLRKVQNDPETNPYTQLISAGIVDRFIRRPWFYFSPLVVPVSGGGKKKLTRGIFNRFVWQDYYRLKIIGQFKRKYFSELLLPILLIILVFIYVLIPNIIQSIIQ